MQKNSPVFAFPGFSPKIFLANYRTIPYNNACIMCRCDGIGRRDGLKIRWWRHRVGSSPTTGTSSSQASYRLRRAFYAPHQKLIVRSLCCSSLPNRTRCAGLRFGFGGKLHVLASILLRYYTSEQALYRLLRFFTKIRAHSRCLCGATNFLRVQVHIKLFRWHLFLYLLTRRCGRYVVRSGFFRHHSL